MDILSKLLLGKIITRVGKYMSKKADKTELPTKVSDLANDTGFITNVVEDLVNYYKRSETYSKTEVESMVSSVISGSFEVVDQLPETGDANKIYLLPIAGAEDNSKEEFIWLAAENRFEMIGSTRMRTIRTFKATKTSFDKADMDVIKEYFAANPNPAPAPGDVFVITTNVDGKPFEDAGYHMGEQDWVAMTGHVDAEKVIMRTNIMLAGDYTQVGNVKKGANESKELNTIGKSVKGIFDEVFTKKLQPGAPTQPAVSGFALSGAKAVEAGTAVATASFGTAKLSAGSYQYGPATGVVAESYTVDRVAKPDSFNKAGIAAAASGTDDNDGNGFIIGDGAEANVVTSLAYKVTVAHNEGVVAYNNVKEPSNPEVKIAAGSKTQQTSAYTAFRKYFYGASAEKPAIDSAYVRGLTNSTGAYKAGNITITVPAGSKRVAIACIATAKGVTKVINNTAMNADVTATFVKSTVNVEGANGYTAKPYNIWTFEPANPYENVTTLTVTLG